MKQCWNEAEDECILAFWKLFEAGEQIASIKRALDTRFDGVPSQATIGYRLDRERIRPTFLRVVGDEVRVASAFARFERRKEKRKPELKSPKQAAPTPEPRPVTEEVMGFTANRPRHLCIGKDDTCTNRKTRGMYCDECGGAIYQSPEQKDSWNTVVAKQVGAALGRARRG